MLFRGARGDERGGDAGLRAAIARGADRAQAGANDTSAIASRKCRVARCGETRGRTPGVTIQSPRLV